jgi:glycosyltransferase involved in cell wall biosynthesis
LKIRDWKGKAGQFMSESSISVTLSLGNAPYQKSLPKALAERGMLRRVFTFGPTPEILDVNADHTLKVVGRFPSYRAVQRILWAAWTRLPGKKLSRTPVVATTWLADRRASKWISGGTIFHGWTAACLACLGRAKQQGMRTLVENASFHPREWQREVLAECGQFGVDPRECGTILPGKLIERQEREFLACDKIVVLSQVAKRSFQGLSCYDKVEVILPGVDQTFFAPEDPVSRPATFRVCYVGRLELAKGLGYLLQTWKRLKLKDAELVLAGDCRREITALLAEYGSQNVRVLGIQSGKRVADLYRESSVLVLPSVHEGFGMVILEAMASGLPVIATNRTGAEDCLTNGSDGWIVPARSVDALSEAILWCYTHRDLLDGMGRRARAKIEDAFTLDHYNARIIDLYERLAKDGR